MTWRMELSSAPLRQVLSVESGWNDGLALPIVLLGVTADHPAVAGPFSRAHPTPCGLGWFGPVGIAALLHLTLAREHLRAAVSNGHQRLGQPAPWEGNSIRETRMPIENEDDLPGTISSHERS